MVITFNFFFEIDQRRLLSANQITEETVPQSSFSEMCCYEICILIIVKDS